MVDSVYSIESIPLTTASGTTAVTKQQTAAAKAKEATSAKKLRDDFLQLLSTQLSNQNPLDPMDNHDMTLQMASLSQLEQMENVSRSFAKLQRSFDMIEGAKMIGMEVSFYPKDANGQAMDESRTGIVTEVNIVDSEPTVKVDGHDVAIDEIISLRLPGGRGDGSQATIDQILSYFPDESQQTALQSLMGEMTGAQRQAFLNEIMTRAAELPTEPTMSEFFDWLGTLESVQNYL